MKRKANANAAAGHYRYIFEQADPETLTQGIQWYQDAAITLQDICPWDVRAAAAIAAIYSINQVWRLTVLATDRFIRNPYQPYGLPACYAAALDIWQNGPDQLLSPSYASWWKVQTFYKALTGDVEAVVIDRHMARAAQVRGTVTRTTHEELGTAIRQVSRQMGLTPRETQAVIWVQTRGTP